MANVPTNFHLFPDLPEELRRKIWAAAVDHPRLIDPLLSRTDFRSEPPKRYYHCRPPILFQVCKESRDEALLRYRHVPLPGDLDLGRPLYVNPSQDILYLSHDMISPSRQRGMASSFSIFTPSRSQPSFTPWDNLHDIALCASHATRLIEPLCLRLPSLETVYLLQAPWRMGDALLLKGRVEDHLERRREGRGDGGIPPGLVVEVVTWEGLRSRAGEWGERERGAGTGVMAPCNTCLLLL
jgi:hypothetical protein